MPDLSREPTLSIVRTHPKPPTRVLLPPSPALGVLLLGAAAVLAAAGALVRYYSRTSVAKRAPSDAAVEILAPELETLPAGSTPRL
jgi:hypothetical protein